MASLLRLNLPGAGRKGRLLFCSPHNPGGRERKNLTLKLSYDEGRTWPVSRVIEPGPAAYSDLALGPDHTLYCFFEKGTSLSLARFNLEWASGEQDRLEADKSP
jgi:sialidase-1